MDQLVELLLPCLRRHSFDCHKRSTEVGLIVETALQSDFYQHHRRGLQQLFALPKPLLSQPLLRCRSRACLEHPREMTARQSAGFGQLGDRDASLQMTQHHLLGRYDLRGFEPPLSLKLDCSQDDAISSAHGINPS